MKRDKIIYWIATGLLSLLFLAGAVMYFANYEQVSQTFTNLGFPTWIVYPLAVAKALAVVAILTRKSKLLAEWAYTGLFFDGLMAAGAHIAASDGEAGAAIVAMVLVIVSRYMASRVFGL
ncbi:MAG: DoxX family protein [Bacteroidota bacterium]